MLAAGYGSVTVNISAAGPYQFLVRQQKSSSVAIWGPPGVLLEWAVQGSAGFDTPRTVSCWNAVGVWDCHPSCSCRTSSENSIETESRGRAEQGSTGFYC